MTDRPIIFSRPMIKALLQDRKTQTRRILKVQPGQLDRVIRLDDGSWHQTASDGSHMSPLPVRYAFGDRLWVRENFLPDPPLNHDAWDDHTLSATEWYGCGCSIAGVPPDLRTPHHVRFFADHEHLDEQKWKWRPSIHMPRWASRLTLTVTDVRVQQLHDISRGDAVAEGLYRLKATGRYVVTPGDQYFGAASPDPRDVFSTLWNRINGDGAWEANPWVVALTFTVTKANIDA